MRRQTVRCVEEAERRDRHNPVAQTEPAAEQPLKFERETLMLKACLSIGTDSDQIERFALSVCQRIK